MKRYLWDEMKNKWLKENRNISFEEIVLAINQNKIIKIALNPSSTDYWDQKIYIIDINNYAYIVPFNEVGDNQFLKTVFRSRKYTKKYLTIK